MTNTKRRCFFNFIGLRCVLYLAIAIPLLHAPCTVAAPINAQQAALVAKNYAAKNPSAGKLPARANAALSKEGQALTRHNKSIAFVVPLETTGFVLVRADDDLPPVKLQVTSGTYEELPPNLRHIIETELAGEMEALDALRNAGQSPDKRYKLQWRSYSTSTATTNTTANLTVQPASANTWLTTTAWGQGSPYNCYTPSVPGGNAIAGCNAIALAQLIRYHSKPVAPLTDYSYSDTSGSCQGVHHMSDGCGVGDYDWANMPNTVSAASPLAQQQAIGKLVYHCGVAMGSDYEASSTRAYPSYAPVALTTVFGFTYSDTMHKTSGTPANWYSTIAAEIDANRPLFYAMWEPGGANGHSVVCDGYRNGNEIHLNLGWDGTDSAWYNIDTVTPAYPNNYSWTEHYAVYGIRPSLSGKVTIQQPASNPFITGTAHITIRGIASSGADSVTWQDVDSGASGTATGTDSWSFNFDLQDGNNYIVVTAHYPGGGTDSDSITAVLSGAAKTAWFPRSEGCTVFSGGATRLTGSDLYVGFDSSMSKYQNERSLLNFATFTLPNASTVQSAQIKGKSTGSMATGDSDLSISCFRVTASWSSGSATWSSANNYTTTSGSSVSFSKATEIKYWDATDIAKLWYAGTANNGVVLVSVKENCGYPNDRYLTSGDFALQVNYTTETTPPTVAITSPTGIPKYTTDVATINIAGSASDTQNAIAGVAWRNERTGQSGNCSGSETWSVNGIVLTSGVNRIVITATDGAGNPGSSTLDANYIPPSRILRVSEAAHFGNVRLGESATNIVTLANDGNNTLSVTSIQCPTGFSANLQTFTLSPLESRSVEIVFTPLQVKAYSGDATIGSDKTDGVNIIPCEGNGVPTLLSITIAGSTNVNENATAQYTCVAHYNDASSVDATLSTTWSDDSPFAAIASNGVLTTAEVTQDRPCTLTAIFDVKTNTLALKIRNVNAAPTAISLSNAGVAENQPTGTVVGVFATLDPDTANTFAYSLVSGDLGSFTINGSNLLTAAVFDYETTTNYTIGVRSTDQGGLSTQKVFNIAVINVNDFYRLVVTSAFGGATPSVGTNSYHLGTPVTGLVTNSPIVSGVTTQYVCIGWAGTGSTPGVGTTTNTGSFNMTNDSTLAWLWTTNYWLGTSTNGNGKLTTGNCWWPKGSNAQITATAADHYHFTGWTGQTNGCTINSNVITAPMTMPRAITANFAIDQFSLAVTTPYGKSTPSGTTTNNWATSITVALTNSPVLNGSTTQYVCTGWSGTGSAPATGSNTNTGPFTLTNNSTVAWLWATNFLLDTITNGNGTVDTPDQWCRSGTNLIIIATPAVSNRFLRWSGQTNGCTISSNSITAPMTSPRAITANFIRQYPLTVTTPYGQGMPPFGTNWYDTGYSVTARLTNSPVADGALTQYVCRGWSGSGSVPASGTTTNAGPFTITNNSSITWLWKTNYWLDVAFTGAGSLSTTDRWLVKGTNLQVTATPSTHWHFGQWIGETNGCTITSNKITVLMDMPRSVSASFIIDTNRLIVTTPYGAATIMSGTNWFDYGASNSITVTNSPVTIGGTQYVCRGWTGTGSVPSNGTTTNTPRFALTNNSTIVWNWRTNYWLHVDKQGSGTVSTTDTWLAIGTNLQISAAAATHFVFGNWSGQTNGCTIASNKITVLMNSARTVVAVFNAQLATNNVPKWWLAQYGQTNFNVDAMKDVDKDGMLTWQEWVAGSDPTNINSVFRFTSTEEQPDKGKIFRWPSISNRFYNLSRSTNLLDGPNAFIILQDASNMPSTPTINCYTDTVQGVGPYFYKVDVRE